MANPHPTPRTGRRGKKNLAREGLMLDAVWTKVSKGGRSKLTSQQLLEIVQAGEQGQTQIALAAAYGVTQSTISRVQRALLDTRGYAKQTLHAAAGTLATVAVTASQIAGAAGNADPALELLDRLDVAPKRRQDTPGARILVMVGQSSPDALPPVLRDARPFPGPPMEVIHASHPDPAGESGTHDHPSDDGVCRQ